MPIKIAICFSGYYRSFSDPFNDDGMPVCDYWLKFTKEIYELSNGEINFDFYGHGWYINNLPSSINFKNIKSDDQIEYLAGWISENPDTRLLSLPTIVRFHEDRLWQGEVLGYIIGQHISAWKSISLIEEEYDYVIKTRWDVTQVSPSLDHLVDFLKERHENILFVEQYTRDENNNFSFFRDYSFLISGPKLIKYICSNDISTLIETINLKNLENLKLKNRYDSNGILVYNPVGPVELWLLIFHELNIDFQNIPLVDDVPLFITRPAHNRHKNAKYISHKLFQGKNSIIDTTHSKNKDMS